MKPKTLSALAVPLDIEPMEAKLVEHLPEGDWQYEPKWDGFRCLAFRAGDEVDLKAKSGKPLARYFPEMVATLKSLTVRSFVLDGELAIVRDGEFSFDALLQRIHPAESRIKRLAAETPAIFILFDMLVDASGRSLIEAPLTERRDALEEFFASAKQQRDLKLSPYTLSPGEAGDYVGFTATIANKDRAALTAKLEALVSPPGFTGKAPGGPSRWSTERSEQWQPVKPKLVVEVSYDQVTGNRFRHGTKLVRFRPDKAPRQCTFEQIAPQAKPAKLVADMLKS